MSGPVAIVSNVERALSLSDRTKSLDSTLSNEKSRVSELNGEVSHVSSKTIGFRAGEILLPNGESYSGSLLGNMAEGSGEYVWSDGCKYVGEWRRGMRHGYGKLQWPSGALYEGEFSGGYMHGTGTYTRPDNMMYKGRWRLNLKHGLGYQNFPNGDLSWKLTKSIIMDLDRLAHPGNRTPVSTVGGYYDTTTPDALEMAHFLKLLYY